MRVVAEETDAIGKMYGRCLAMPNDSASQFFSPSQDYVNTNQYLRQILWRQLADSLGKEGAIDGDDLRRIGNRVLRKTRNFARQKHVPWCACPKQIACDGNTDHRGNPASIQVVALHDDNGPSETRA